MPFLKRIYLSMLKHLLFLCLLIIAIKPAHAQDEVRSQVYPQGYFRYPLDLPPSTAGSFGELRANHFHSGLDFRTNQRIGYPVHAPADGWVSRLRVQFGGFGNAVYITHPNGFTTVYGHLDHFAPELLTLIRQQQYAQHSYVVDFNLVPFQVPVTKNQVFAWSGNTGGSAGPHLHFEIRDTKTQETINAQLFGLTIPDRVPPTISSISIYHLNGRPFSESTLRQAYGVAGAAGNYHLLKPQTFDLSGQIGFGISCVDQNSASPSHNGVFSIQLNVDGKTVYTFAAERFAFDQTHAINAYIDYPNFIRTNGFTQKCFILPGAGITLYPQSINRGLVDFNDDAEHNVEFVVRDIAGNTSRVAIKVKSSVPKDHPVFHPQGTLFKYNTRNEFNANNVKVIVDPGNLYDDLDFRYSVSAKRPGAFSAVHHIHDNLTPIHDSVEVWIRPDIDLSKYANKALVLNTASGACESKYEDGWVKGKITRFGNYEVRIDTVAPVITPINIRNGANLSKIKAIFLKMRDNMSGCRDFNCKIDNKWVLMERDYKSKILSYTFGPEIGTGKHTFELTVTDYKDNSTTYTAEFYR